MNPELVELLAACDVILAEYRVIYPAGPATTTARFCIDEVAQEYERLDRAVKAVRKSYEGDMNKVIDNGPVNRVQDVPDRLDLYRRVGERAARAGQIQQRLVQIQREEFALLGERTILEGQLRELQAEAGKDVEEAAKL